MAHRGYSLLTGLLVAVLGFGCASSNVNPPKPKAHRGYVDFYSPGQTNLYWSIKEWHPGDSGYKTLFAQLKPLPDGVLRLEVAPGPKRFQVTFMNRVIEAPLNVQLTAQEGIVTPVKVELIPVAETSVLQKQEQVGPNISGAGRKTSYSTQAGTVERLMATVLPPMPYQPKDKMSYPH